MCYDYLLFTQCYDFILEVPAVSHPFLLLKVWGYIAALLFSREKGYYIYCIIMINYYNK
jgi:hypothetical protein